MPRPLEGVRILAIEQMQALPYATQLLARLGADVVKIESTTGESGRGAQPGINDPHGRFVGATFLRNNHAKRSVAIDLRSDEGRDLVLRLAPKFDVVAENFRAGAIDRLGLGYEAIKAAHPKVIYASVSGFGSDPASPYANWGAYASIVEAMSGIYDYMRRPDEAPRANPVGALGDISSALFATIGILAALRHRELTGEGQLVDVAMFDATVAMTDIVMNFASMGQPRQPYPPAFILDSFRATDGWFVMQIVREHQFEKLAELVGHPEWIGDERFATRAGWGQHLEDVIRPAVESWASKMTKLEAVALLHEGGVAAGPCFDSGEVINDPHLALRNMVTPLTPPGGGAPVLTPGNPVKLSNVEDEHEQRVPWLGEHTNEVLQKELGLDDAAVASLADRGVISVEPS
jgi:crotonobetainyl-CoA:carnitine CoA-transferase CaiB-like acyl-CoA transferase